MKEAMFYEKINSAVKCYACWRECKISSGETGFCGVRKNENGKLYSLNYGRVISFGIDPIEKKPFYHFAPGSKTLSLACVGCNFRCKFCCNFEISQEWNDFGIEKTPDEIVKNAEAVQGISYTYTEPTVWIEYALDAAKIARRNGLYNTMVTNGYANIEVVKEIGKYMDAVVIDLKNSGNHEGYLKLSSVPNPEKIFETILEFKNSGIWIEITNLIIPKWGENEKEVRKFCKWVYDNLGSDTPVHFLRFYPAYKLSLPETSLKFLEKCAKIAKDEGLNFVYLGNVPGSEYENTYCSGCGGIVIERLGIFIKNINLKNGKCAKCGRDIPIAGVEWMQK